MNMKSNVAKLIVVGIATFAIPSFVQADTGSLLTKQQMEKKIRRDAAKAKRVERMSKYKKQLGGKHTGKVKNAKVPELDPNAFGSALALLAGGTIVVAERRRASLRSPAQ